MGFLFNRNDDYHTGALPQLKSVSQQLTMFRYPVNCSWPCPTSMIVSDGYEHSLYISEYPRWLASLLSCGRNVASLNSKCRLLRHGNSRLHHLFLVSYNFTVL